MGSSALAQSSATESEGGKALAQSAATSLTHNNKALCTPSPSRCLRLSYKYKQSICSRSPRPTLLLQARRRRQRFSSSVAGPTPSLKITPPPTQDSIARPSGPLPWPPSSASEGAADVLRSCCAKSSTMKWKAWLKKRLRSSGGVKERQRACATKVKPSHPGAATAREGAEGDREREREMDQRESPLKGEGRPSLCADRKS